MRVHSYRYKRLMEALAAHAAALFASGASLRDTVAVLYKRYMLDAMAMAMATRRLATPANFHVCMYVCSDLACVYDVCVCIPCLNTDK
jgi:hypothetical protein